MLSPETSKAAVSYRGRAEPTEVDEEDHRVRAAGGGAARGRHAAGRSDRGVGGGMPTPTSATRASIVACGRPR